MNTIFQNISLTMVCAGIAASLSIVYLLPANAAKNSFFENSENQIFSVTENVENDEQTLGKIAARCRKKGCDKD